MGKRGGRPKNADRIIDLTAAPLPVVPEESRALLPVGLRPHAGKFGFRKSPLGYMIAKIPGGRRAVFHLLALHDHEDCIKLTQTWNEMSRNDQVSLTLELVIERAGLTAEDFMAAVSRASTRFNIEIGNTLATFAYPKIMQASIERALDPKGGRERRIHLEKTGFASAPGRPFISVTQTNQQANFASLPEEGDAPRIEQTARRIVRDLPPAK